jgi:preprotein translocase SecF subunit
MVFKIVERRKYYFLFSGLIILAGIIAMGISVATYPEHSIVRLSIDFTGGSLVEIPFQKVDPKLDSKPITEEDITSTFGTYGVGDVRVQRLGDASANRWQVRSGYFNDATTTQIKTKLNEIGSPRNLQINEAELRISTVSPVVGGEVTRAAFLAVVVASAAVLLWIMFAFRSVEGAFRYGMCAVLAMIHDVLVMVGVMSILGLVFKWEVDSLFLTGLLTVVGYSVQDTIVVFDRIRENVLRHRGEPFQMVVNRSILEMLQRSLSMQLLVAFMMLSLALVGGESIRQFVTILLIGLLSGTYSSTFTAIPLLVSWEKGEIPFVNRGGGARLRSKTA